MALVSYGSSDESESELESENKEIISTVKTKDADTKSSDEQLKLRNGGDKFSNIPKSSGTFQGIQWDVLKKLTTKSGPIKISAFEIPDDDDEEEDKEYNEKKKLIQPSAKGSGLLALLPNPKNETFITSNSVTNDSVTLKKSKPLIPQQLLKKPVKKAAKKKSNKTILSDSEDEDMETGTGIDFFSLEPKDDSNLPIADIEPELKELPSTNRNTEVISKKFEMIIHHETKEDNTVNYNDEEMELNEAAIEILCGKRGLKRKSDQMSEVININGESLVADSQTLLSKELTLESSYAGQSKGPTPSTLQKRKHQITHLAYLAKSNELDLKNQWANNRYNRKQTQAKYGF